MAAPYVALRARAIKQGRESSGALGKRSLKAVINDALRRGLGLEPAKRTKPYRVKAHSSAFAPGVDAGRLNQLVDELEAGEFLAKMHRRP